jgi:hypothetical protein
VRTKRLDIRRTVLMAARLRAGLGDQRSGFDGAADPRIGSR